MLRRKLLAGLFVPGLVMIAVCTATAQNAITLEATGSYTSTFTVTESGNWTLRLTPNRLKGTTLGAEVFNSGPAPYSLTKAEGSTVSGTLTGATSWSMEQFSPLTFSDDAGGSLLTGNLELVSLTETGRTGQFDTTLVLDLTGLSGSLTHIFSPPGAAAQLGSHGAGEQLSAKLFKDKLDPVALQVKGPCPPYPYDPWHPHDPWDPHDPWHSHDPWHFHHHFPAAPEPTPEPTSMLLFGSGLLILGGLARRRRR